MIPIALKELYLILL